MLPMLLAGQSPGSPVVSIHEAVARMRVLRAAHAGSTQQVREITEVREGVQHFVHRARDGVEFVLPMPISSAARQAALSEAKRLGVRAEVVSEGDGSSVRVVNLPCSEVAPVQV